VIHRAVATVLALGLVVACSSAPTSGPRTSPQPAEQTAEDAQFRLTFRMASSIQHAGEPIDLQTTLAYLGTDVAVIVGSDWSPPVWFGLEHIDGDLDLDGPISLLTCQLTPLDAGVPLQIPFIKNGGYSSDDPDAAYWKAFFDDRVFRLPAGRWRLSANFQGMTSDRCEGAIHRLRAALTFDVVP
jgi:hypothetical protein